MPASRPAFPLRAIGIACLLGAFACHVAAAQAIGGSYIAYRDHVLGFAVLTLVTGAILVAIGRRFWRAFPERTLLLIGVLQLVLGIYVYIERFSVHG